MPIDKLNNQVKRLLFPEGHASTDQAVMCNTERIKLDCGSLRFVFSVCVSVSETEKTRVDTFLLTNIVQNRTAV